MRALIACSGYAGVDNLKNIPLPAIGYGYGCRKRASLLGFAGANSEAGDLIDVEVSGGSGSIKCWSFDGSVDIV